MAQKRLGVKKADARAVTKATYLPTHTADKHCIVLAHWRHDKPADSVRT